MDAIGTRNPTPHPSPPHAHTYDRGDPDQERWGHERRLTGRGAHVVVIPRVALRYCLPLVDLHVLGDDDEGTRLTRWSDGWIVRKCQSVSQSVSCNTRAIPTQPPPNQPYTNLKSTRQILREQNETYKLEMYRKLSSTIVFFVTLFGALTVVVLLARVG